MPLISKYICRSVKMTIAFIVFAGMFIGGASGATVGGIKVIRALLIAKGIRWQINRVFFTERTIKIIHFNQSNYSWNIYHSRTIN